MMVILAVFAMLFGGPNASIFAGSSGSPSLHGAPVAYDGMSGGPSINGGSGGRSVTAPVARTSHDGMSGGPSITEIH
jgi:hypothetical protein